MKALFAAAAVLVFVSRALAISPFEAAKHVGEVVVIDGGRPACVDMIHNTITFGLLNGNKEPVFRAVIKIENLDLYEYLRALDNGPDFTISGRIEDDPKVTKWVTSGWDWEGGPQIIVTSKSQIQRKQKR